MPLKYGDEIAMFDGDRIIALFCYFRELTIDDIFDNYIKIWSNVSHENGYTPGNQITWKCWDAEKGLESLSFTVNFLDIEEHNTEFFQKHTNNSFPVGSFNFSYVELSFSSSLNKGALAGKIITSVPGYAVPVLDATVSIHEAGLIVKTDSEGKYSFSNLDIGTYTLEVESPFFSKHLVNNINIKPGENNLDQIEISKFKFDISGDGKIGMEEAIITMKILSGMK